MRYFILLVYDIFITKKMFTGYNRPACFTRVTRETVKGCNV